MEKIFRSVSPLILYFKKSSLFLCLSLINIFQRSTISSLDHLVTINRQQRKQQWVLCSEESLPEPVTSTTQQPWSGFKANTKLNNPFSHGWDCGAVWQLYDRKWQTYTQVQIIVCEDSGTERDQTAIFSVKSNHTSEYNQNTSLSFKRKKKKSRSLF